MFLLRLLVQSLNEPLLPLLATTTPGGLRLRHT